MNTEVQKYINLKYKLRSTNQSKVPEEDVPHEKTRKICIVTY